MSRHLRVARETWPIAGSFRIARGAKTEAHVVVAEISEGAIIGRGECVPYTRYGESVASVAEAIEALKPDIAAGLSREDLQKLLPAGAARNAIDCALIDFTAKTENIPAHELIGVASPKPLRTAFTLSVDTPDAMGKAANQAAAKGYGLLKLKLADQSDVMRVEAVRQAAPKARLIVDANEGWSYDDLVRITPTLAALGVALIEQPLRAETDDALSGFKSSVPLCADESCHTRADLHRIAGRYSHINVKLDKTGGLTEALALTREARALGLGLMIGCMVSTSLSMAPAALLGEMAEFIDLDGPLLLARDREPGVVYRGDMLEPPPARVWG